VERYSFRVADVTFLAIGGKYLGLGGLGLHFIRVKWQWGNIIWETENQKFIIFTTADF